VRVHVSSAPRPGRETIPRPRGWRRGPRLDRCYSTAAVISDPAQRHTQAFPRDRLGGEGGPHLVSTNDAAHARLASRPTGAAAGSRCAHPTAMRHPRRSWAQTSAAGVKPYGAALSAGSLDTIAGPPPDGRRTPQRTRRVARVDITGLIQRPAGSCTAHPPKPRPITTLTIRPGSSHLSHVKRVNIVHHDHIARPHCRQLGNFCDRRRKAPTKEPSSCQQRFWHHGGDGCAFGARSQ
jgi:hypothetical protein